MFLIFSIVLDLWINEIRKKYEVYILKGGGKIIIYKCYDIYIIY